MLEGVYYSDNLDKFFSSIDFNEFYFQEWLEQSFSKYKTIQLEDLYNYCVENELTKLAEVCVRFEQTHLL